MKTELIEFLEVKKQYIKDGYELFYLFETAYIPEGQDLYIKKLNGLIKKCDDEHVDNEKSIINYLKFAYLQKIYTKYEPMINLLHIGCKSGFIDGEIAFLDEVGNENENFDIQMKKKWITAQMEKILKQLPDKSVIIMTQEKHYLIKAKTSRCLNESMSQNICKSKKMTTRERQAQMKGQKKITSFFPSIKSSSVSTSQKKSFIERPTIPDPGYKFELMARVLRGDTVKVLWLPRNIRELNPSEYVKTFLLSYVALEHEKFMLQSETEITPSCSQQSNEDFHDVALEPLHSNPSNPDNIILDSDDENSNDSSDSVDIGVILKQKLKKFCFKAIKSHDSTWKEAIDFVENIEQYYENNLI